MDLPALALVLGAVFVWALVSNRARSISAPIYFVVVGLLLAEGVELLHLAPDPHLTKLMAEVTLVWVLFADASRVRVSSLRRDAGRYARLLGIGLPLTIVLGAVAGMGLLGLSPWYAVLLGAALAPTDAALGATVMTDERVRYRIRQTLNVESGLNDGIATPVVTAGDRGDRPPGRLHHRLRTGRCSAGTAHRCRGRTGDRDRRRDLAPHRAQARMELGGDRGPAVLALALLAFVIATLLLANGYVAAFVAGMAFGASAGRGGTAEVYYVEQTCGLASMLCWMLFGALAVPTLAADWSWRILVYAVVSLTVVRMVPVAPVAARFRSRLALGDLHRLVRAPRPRLGRVRADRRRGSARRPGAVGDVVATIGLSVLLSVLLHGLTARPLVAWLAAAPQPAETDPSTPPDVQVRHLIEPPRPKDAIRRLGR